MIRVGLAFLATATVSGLMKDIEDDTTSLFKYQTTQAKLDDFEDELKAT